jgi:hypothetical protein
VPLRLGQQGQVPQSGRWIISHTALQAKHLYGLILAGLFYIPYLMSLLKVQLSYADQGYQPRAAQSRNKWTTRPALRNPDAQAEVAYESQEHGVWIYRGNSLTVLEAIAAKYPKERFDMIFADPPYFLSNGGITCHAGKMVKVDKGDWDKSRGHELNHEFNLEWLRRCQHVPKPNGSIWVTGTHHVIFSVGFAMQQLGFKILNDIAWEKPNPPQTGTTSLIDADPNGMGTSVGPFTTPKLSADGRLVAFKSPNATLVADDRNHNYDVFVRDAIGPAL